MICDLVLMALTAKFVVSTVIPANSKLTGTHLYISNLLNHRFRSNAKEVNRSVINGKSLIFYFLKYVDNIFGFKWNYSYHVLFNVNLMCPFLFSFAVCFCYLTLFPIILEQISNLLFFVSNLQFLKYKDRKICDI